MASRRAGKSSVGMPKGAFERVPMPGVPEAAGSRESTGWIRRCLALLRLGRVDRAASRHDGPRGVRFRSGFLFSLAALGCAGEGGGGSVETVGSAIELDQNGKVFALGTRLHSERSPAARQREMAVRATGALLIPFVDAAGVSVLSANGTRLRGSCGVTFVAPSYAVTAAHCVDGSMSDLAHLVVEMYRPTAYLEQGVVRAALLDGVFPELTHARLDASDGYLVDRYDCRLISRCSEQYGGPIHCEGSTGSSVDTALLVCSGTPGEKYGFVPIAGEDDPEAEVFMPWKHEVYSMVTSPGDDLWQHYVVAPAGTEGGTDPAEPADFAQNYHYFGLDSAGVDTNQLVPLIPVDYTSDGQTRVPHRKNSASNIGVNTDLLGCHGTSGSGVLQQGQNGLWELLGPVFHGNPEHETYLCNHVPSLDGYLREPGSQGVNYMLLATTQYLFSLNRAEILSDCDPFLPPATTLYTHTPCWQEGLRRTGENSGVVEHLSPATCLSTLDVLRGSVFRLGAGETVNVTGFQTQADQLYRLGIQAWSPSGCPGAPCPRVSVALEREELLAGTFEQVAPQPIPVAAGFGSRKTGTLTLALGAEQGGVEIGSLTLLREGVANSFDSERERLEAVLVDLDPALSVPAPMRFVGDGRQGFAALLDPAERMILTRQAILPGRRWAARFLVTPSGVPAALTCGFLGAGGEVLLATDCSTGRVQLDDASSFVARAGFFVQTSPASSPVLLDDFSLVSDAMPDSDGDSVPDAVDDCPNGPLPPNELLRTDLPANSMERVCVPEPASFTLSVPTLLNACEEATLSGRLATVNGRALAPLHVAISTADPTLLLPIGTHTVEWDVTDRAGRVYATLTQTLSIVHELGAECCPANRTLTQGSAANDALNPDGASACCVLADAGDDFVVGSRAADWLWGGPGSDYLKGGGGDDTLIGGEGDDYLTGGDGGSVTVYAGAGDDTVHVPSAASARIFGGGGNDVLVASGGPDTIFPGNGALLVLAGEGDDTVTLSNECELVPGMRLVGGDGEDTLVTPVSSAALRERGVLVEEFETVVVDTSLAYLSDCFGR